MTTGMVQPALIVPLRYSIPRAQRVGFFQYWAGLGRVGLLKYSIGYPIFARVYLGISGIISLLVNVSQMSMKYPVMSGYTQYFRWPEILDLTEMSCKNKIWGYTWHFGLPDTHWFSKLIRVGYHKKCQEADGPCLYLTKGATTVNDIHTCHR